MPLSDTDAEYFYCEACEQPEAVLIISANILTGTMRNTFYCFGCNHSRDGHHARA